MNPLVSRDSRLGTITPKSSRDDRVHFQVGPTAFVPSVEFTIDGHSGIRSRHI